MLVIYICAYISTCALIRSHTGMCMYLYMHTHHYALLRNVYMYNDLYIHIYVYDLLRFQSLGSDLHTLLEVVPLVAIKKPVLLG